MKSTTEELNQNEKALSSVCHQCGYPLNSTQLVCPHCGTPTSDGRQETAQKKAEGYKMKWYYFLIYFATFANAILNVITAIMCFTGVRYGGRTDLVYAVFPGSQIGDVICGIICIGLAIFVLVTRSALRHYKHQAPQLVFWVYILNAIVPMMSAVITGLIFYDVLTWLPLAIAVIIANINRIYFEKRRELFIN